MRRSQANEKTRKLSEYYRTKDREELKIGLSAKVITFLLLLAMGTEGVSQSGVRFMTGSLTAVQDIARERNKNLLIDTYASWCIPCKRMDKVFAKKKVGDFFNDNYITYKVNMDGPYGNQVRAQYDVVFLPTIIIIAPDGSVKYKVDREMSAEELISVGNLALREGISIASDATAIHRTGETVRRPTTVTRKIPPTKRTTSAADDKILYVMDLDGSPPPADYLKKEAYFRLELMDGSHVKSANKYLKTQEDWSTKKNMRFILDFVNTPMSEEYRHIIDNKQLYYDTFTKEEVDNALSIMVYRHLYNGIPRPDMDMTIRMFEELEYKQPKVLAEKYFISRYKIDRQHQEAYDMSMHYLTDTNTSDAKSTSKFLDYMVDNAHQFDKEQLIAATDVIKNSTLEENSLLPLKPKVIKLLIKAESCKDAKDMFEMVKKEADAQNEVLTELNSITFNCGV